MEEELQRVMAERGLIVSSIPEKGRCLMTAKDFSPGEVIINQEPYVSVPNNSPSVSRCEVCFKSNYLKKCSACHVVWYCGSTCQKSDWKLHRTECQALSKIEKNKQKALTPSIRLMVKLYLKKKLQEEKVIPATATDKYSLVEALISHLPDVGKDQLVLFAQMANLVNAILQWPQLDLKDVTNNFSKMACNAHTICDPELRPLGTGLYPVISVINHSCVPNSVLVFEGREAVVRAVQRLPKGTEVLISYIETAGTTTTRQKTLKEQYFFTCACPHCIKLGQNDDIKESAILEGYRCRDHKCSGYLLRHSDKEAFICQQCGLVREKEDILKIAGEVKLLSDKAQRSLKSGNKHEACSLYKTVEKLQVKLCHPFSLNLMQTRESLLKIHMELNDWKEALLCCRSTLPVYEKAYRGCHPMLGLQYYTCGKLEWLLGYTEDSVRSFTNALDILRFTHGTNVPFMKELIDKPDEARAEASYKFKPMDDDRRSLQSEGLDSLRPYSF